MLTYSFPCGCSYKVLEKTPSGPRLDFRIDDIPRDCPATWALLATGRTAGVWQLDSSLGKDWTKRLKPKNFEHLAALGAILRPGCLQALTEGASLTEHYCRRKNGEEEVKPFHPLIEPLLTTTYQIICYQENTMHIARAVALFDTNEVEKLRKAISKKVQQQLADVEKMFVEKAEKANLMEIEKAKELFALIRKSGRYLFCKAHAVPYGCLGYKMAYIKAHFPRTFYAAWLKHANSKADAKVERRELVEEAKLFDIKVEPPDVFKSGRQCAVEGDVVRMGIADIGGVGESVYERWAQVKNRPSSWFEFLIDPLSYLARSTAIAFAKCGAIPLGLTRSEMIAEIKVWHTLNEKEQKWVKQGKFHSLKEAVRALAQPIYRKPKRKRDTQPIGPFGGCSTESRRKKIESVADLLENPPSPYMDSPTLISRWETELLGVPLTCSPADGLEKDTSVKEFLDGKKGPFTLGVEIRSRREFYCKKGKNAGRKMAYLTVADASGSMANTTVFSDEFDQFENVLFEGNCVLLFGDRDRKRDGFIVKKAIQG